MTSNGFALFIICVSMLVSLAAYVRLSRHESTYINILTPVYLLQIPANFLLPVAYIRLFGVEYSVYAYIYVYASLAAMNWAFVIAYTRRYRKSLVPRHTYSYRNFLRLSWICVVFAYIVYIPVLIEFKEFLLDPRQIYMLTRTGYGQESFVSSTLAYLAVIFSLFSKGSWQSKALIVIASSIVVSLHGSKGQLMGIVFILLLFQIFVRGKRMSVLPALLCSLAIALVLSLLFAMTLPLGGASDAIQEISEYSDYTRNAMLVIDSRFPRQYGRLTAEANLYTVVPRLLVSNKPKDFGGFRLAEEFYPAWFDADTGSPDFGIGVQYADFGVFAIVYLILFSLLTGWLAQVFVARVKLTRHPSDFILVAFLAGVPIIPVGGAAWLFPEMILLAVLVRYLSSIGADSCTRLVRTEHRAVGNA